jgi:glycosyltransferase involved in cell wall biosynthesis
MISLNNRSESLQTLTTSHDEDKITVIIPTLDEALAIKNVLGEMPNELLGEIIVVDSSVDDTPKIAESSGAIVIREPRKGYGRALQTGIENSEGDVVIFIDGDYTYDPREIPRIAEPILNGKCDVVLGNRLNGKIHHGAMDPINRIGNTVLSLIFSMVFLKRVCDTQCGLRAIRRQFLKGLSYKDYGMPYATEQLAKLVKKGARIRNVPISYRPRIGVTKLCKWTDGFSILKVVLRELLST